MALEKAMDTEDPNNIYKVFSELMKEFKSFKNIWRSKDVNLKRFPDAIRNFKNFAKRHNNYTLLAEIHQAQKADAFFVQQKQ